MGSKRHIAEIFFLKCLPNTHRELGQMFFPQDTNLSDLLIWMIIGSILAKTFQESRILESWIYRSTHEITLGRHHRFHQSAPTMWVTTHQLTHFTRFDILFCHIDETFSYRPRSTVHLFKDANPHRLYLLVAEKFSTKTRLCTTRAND